MCVSERVGRHSHSLSQGGWMGTGSHVCIMEGGVVKVSHVCRRDVWSAQSDNCEKKKNVNKNDVNSLHLYSYLFLL